MSAIDDDLDLLNSSCDSWSSHSHGNGASVYGREQLSPPPDDLVEKLLRHDDNDSGSDGDGDGDDGETKSAAVAAPSGNTHQELLLGCLQTVEAEAKTGSKELDLNGALIRCLEAKAAIVDSVVGECDPLKKLNAVIDRVRARRAAQRTQAVDESAAKTAAAVAFAADWRHDYDVNSQEQEEAFEDTAPKKALSEPRASPLSPLPIRRPLSELQAASGSAALLQPSQYVSQFDLDQSAAVFEDRSHKKRLSSDFEAGKTEQPAANVNANSNATGCFVGEAKNDGDDPELCRRDLSFSGALFQTLRSKFGIRGFRPLQLQCVNAALLNHDCFVLMPTGGGKSLCYQLPAVCEPGVTVVVSPLISLIHDQVSKLKELGVAAEHLSGDDWNRQKAIYSQLRNFDPGAGGGSLLLYVTPEKVSSSAGLNDIFAGLYQRQLLRRLVIDEAHCVSQWGHDFRPDYKLLRRLRDQFPSVPMMALTATATPRIRLDILHQLGMSRPKWFICSFNRPNLQYEVREKKSGKSLCANVAQLVRQEFARQSGIVYCLSRKECDDVAAKLNAEPGLGGAVAYHAGLNDKERIRVQERWIRGEVMLVCATIAFGMGVDKPDVRFVIHYSLPKSMEGYYQESGRAGRDGKKSKCVLYYAYSDMHRMRKLIDSDEKSTVETRRLHYDNLLSIVRYCENTADCRRAQQLEYFGEVFDPQLCRRSPITACDNCRRERAVKVNLTSWCVSLVQAVRRLAARTRHNQRNFTMNHLVDIVRGSKTKKVLESEWNTDPAYNSASSAAAAAISQHDIHRLLRMMVLEGYLREDLLISKEGVATAYLKPGGKSHLLGGPQHQLLLEMVPVKGKKSSLLPATGDHAQGDELQKMEDECFSELKSAVTEVFPDLKSCFSALPVECYTEIASTLPQSSDDLLNIDQMTEVRLQKYGDVLLNVCRQWRTKRMQYLTSITEKRQKQVARNGSADNAGHSYGTTTTTSSASKSSTTWRGGRGGRYFRGGRGRGGGAVGRKRKRAGNDATGGGGHHRPASQAGRGNAAKRARGSGGGGGAVRSATTGLMAPPRPLFN